MKLIVPLSIAFFCSHLCLSQNVVFEYKPEFKPFTDGSGYGSARLNLDNSDKKIYVIHNGNKIDYLLLNKDFSIAEKLTPPQGFPGTMYVYKDGREHMGSMINEKTKTAYAFHRLINQQKKGLRPKKALEEYRVETIDFANRKVSNKIIFVPPTEEDYVSSFTYNNKFHIITCFSEPKQLSVRIFDENGQITKKDFSLSFLDEVLKKEKLVDFICPAEQYVNNIDYKDDEMDFPVKVFMENEKTILFTISVAKKTPQLLRLDLETSKADLKEIPPADFCISDEKKDPSVNNVHFLNGKLYVVNACKKKSQLYILNPTTLVAEKKYELSETSNINLAEPATIKKGEKGAEYLTDKEDIIKKLNDGAPQVYVYNDTQGNTIISFGMYSENFKGDGGKFVRSPSAPTTFVTGTYAGSNVPITRSFPNPTQMSYQSGSVTVVKTLLICKIVMNPSNELIKLKTPLPPLTQAWEYHNKYKLKTSCSNKFMMSIKDQYFIEYMNSKTETLYLEEIQIKN